MEKIKGFTLIELLVVIGILTILSAIAIPNYQNAQTRSKVARAHADMRTLTTALEAYKVDTNKYPCACRNGVAITSVSYEVGDKTVTYDYQDDSNHIGISSLINCNDHVIMDKSHTQMNANWRSSFSVDPNFKSLTTPVAYISSYPADPFADTPGLVYGYANTDNLGWMLWSFGPDGDESDGGEVGEAKSRNKLIFPVVYGMNHPQNWAEEPAPYTMYHPSLSNPTTTLLVEGFTYDPTNGIGSGGDIWRIQQ